MSDELPPIEERYQKEFDTLRDAAESIQFAGLAAEATLKLTSELIILAFRIPAEYFNRYPLPSIDIRASEPTPKIGAGSEGVGDE